MSTTDNRTPPASTADPKDMSPRSADEALDGLDPQASPDELLSAAIQVNVRRTVSELLAPPEAKSRMGEGALYELQTGRVRFLN